MHPLRSLQLFVFLLLFAAFSISAEAAEFSPKRINLKKTLWGVEYTFQDEEMVNESGRMTMETPHKRERFEVLKRAYIQALGLPNAAQAEHGDDGFKPGAEIQVPGDGKHVMTMEPVTIEVNTPPRRFDEIENSAEKIFEATTRASLVPYVRPAGERSGMGHIHVGAIRMGDNPFYKYPNLLRNMMVYAHQHPSLMWGFAEAYDIGGASNITTLHNAHPTDRTGQHHLEEYDPDYLHQIGERSNMRHGPAANQEEAFFRAVKKFDAWYLEAKRSGDTSDGLRQFLRALKAEGLDSAFYHYGMFNLEHLDWLAKRRTPVTADYIHNKKATVEFRNFRPPASPKHAKANAELLLTLMDKFSAPSQLVPTKAISADAYNRYHSASVVANDWTQVKKDLGRTNKLWDESIKEYVDVHLNAEAIRLSIPELESAELLPAYSPKFKKGTKFELRVPVSDSSKAPELAFEGTPLDFEKVTVRGKSYWIAMIDVKESGNSSLTVARLSRLNIASECKRWFATVNK
jgi:hypothetical protein